MEKVSVVTGGGSGIGKAIAEQLGFQGIVVITGRTVSKLENCVNELKAKGCNVVAYACDVSKRESVTELADYCASLGDVTKVVHAAGVSGTMGDAEQIIRTNALGTVYVNQEFYKVMNGGCIIDVASDSGYVIPDMFVAKKAFPLCITNEELFLKKMVKRSCLLHNKAIDPQFAYMGSKRFVVWYAAKCAFKYMRNKGIRVVSLSPGFVETPMTEAEGGESTDIFLSYTGEGRGATPEELAFCAMSVLDERNSFLYGADILCDGGCVGAGYSFFKASKRKSLEECNEMW